MTKVEIIRTLIKINQMVQPYGFVAGGALRSYFEGKDPRDVDVFLIDNTDENMEKLLETLESREDIEMYETVDKDYMGTVLKVASFDYKGLTVTIIPPVFKDYRPLYGKPEELVELFDFDINSIALNEDDEFITTSICSLENLIDKIGKRDATYLRAETESRYRFDERIARYRSYGYSILNYDEALSKILEREAREIEEWLKGF